MYDLPRLPGPRASHSAAQAEPASAGTEAGPAPSPESPPERQSQSQPNGPSYTRESLLDALARLTALTMIGVVAPAQANSIRGIIQTMLAHMQPSPGTAARSSGAAVDVEPARRFVREQPLLLDFLTQFLTAEQIAELLRDEESNNEP